MQQLKLGSVIFTLLCVILIWTPIPVGSHRPWAWSLLELMIGVVFLLHLANSWRSHGPALWHRWFNTLFLPIMALQLYLWLQMTGYLPFIQSIDPKQTEIMLLKGLFFLMWLQLVCIYTNTAFRLRMRLATPW